ncbi:MAG: DUF1840 domain-containing protein [Betaproteobacteria bacterium]|nr:DUF1840 domain-containing protein [Betaproteobacteria bacterium]NBY72412.1 DUF1840 domain-containing protein [Betaproteobacteria bacterium]
MIYKFKSRATADVLMLQPVAERLLQLIGKTTPAPTGIITLEQALHAIAALEEAILREETPDPNPKDKAFGAAAPKELGAGQDQAEGQHVTLRQRATPLIQMLRRAHKAGQPVVWGV